MISRQQLDRLTALRSDAGIVSVYLHVDPHLMHEPAQVLTGFKSAAKRFAARPENARWRAALERERPRLLRWLADWRPASRGAAIFACEPDGLWEVVHLDVEVPNRVRVEVSAHTSILARVRDEHAGIVVVLVQRDRGSIWTTEQKVGVEVDSIQSEVPGRHAQGGWSQARFQRHVDYHVTEHLKRIVDDLQTLYTERGFDRLMVGGAEPALSEFVKLLPAPVSRRLVGTFPVDMKHETEAQMLDRARELRRIDERREERQLVERIVDGARSGNRGTLGLHATLAAAFEGRVQHLAVPERFSAPGSVCGACGWFAAERFTRCPACSGAAEATDVGEWAIEAVLASGGEIEVVYGEALERLQAEGGVGALLRY